jgi:hypothetical protein
MSLDADVRSQHLAIVMKIETADHSLDCSVVYVRVPTAENRPAVDGA